MTTLQAAQAAYHRLPTLYRILISLLASLVLWYVAGGPEAGISLGALTLVESAKLSRDELQRGVMETFFIESPILERLPFEDIEGNAYAYNEEAALPGVEFRAVNAAYAESTGTVNQKSEKLVILGGEADVDKFIVQTRGNVNDQRATQTDLKTKALAYKFQDHFINGDTAVDANGFDGLKKRLTGAQVIAAATNGLGPVAGAHAFFDVLNDAVSLVRGGVDLIISNKSTLGKVKNSARRLGAALDFREDALGRRFDTYDGIPWIDIGQKADGTEILPFTETQGTAVGICSSIYFVSFGGSPEAGKVTGLTNGGVQTEDLGILQDKPSFRTRIEFYCGLGIFSGKAASRLTGVLNA